jgi:hypothetical protein
MAAPVNPWLALPGALRLTHCNLVLDSSGDDNVGDIPLRVDVLQERVNVLFQLVDEK